MKSNSESRGFIFSVKKERIFNLNKKAEGKSFTPYNDYYFTFGNGDLKLESTKNEIRSNFGLNSSFFTEGSEAKVKDLFDQED